MHITQDSIASRSLPVLLAMLLVPFGCSAPVDDAQEPPASSASGGGGDSSTTGGDSSTTGGDSSTTGGDSSTTGGDSSTTGGDSSTTGGDSSTTGGDPPEPSCPWDPPEDPGETIQVSGTTLAEEGVPTVLWMADPSTLDEKCEPYWVFAGPTGKLEQGPDNTRRFTLQLPSTPPEGLTLLWNTLHHDSGQGAEFFHIPVVAGAFAILAPGADLGVKHLQTYGLPFTTFGSYWYVLLYAHSELADDDSWVSWEYGPLKPGYHLFRQRFLDGVTIENRTEKLEECSILIRETGKNPEGCHCWLVTPGDPNTGFTCTVLETTEVPLTETVVLDHDLSHSPYASPMPSFAQQ